MSELLAALEVLATDWLLPRSVQALPLFATVLLVDAALGRRIGPEARGLLWTLALALPCLPLGLEAGWAPLPHPAPLAGAAASLPAWTRVLAVLWLAGALVHLGLLVAGELGHRRRLARLERVPSAWLDRTVAEVAAGLGMRRAPSLLVLRGLDEALTLGLLRPRVLLPLRLCERARGDARARFRLRQVLAHELAHVRRRDPLVVAAWRLLLAPFWFHPLQRFALRRAELCAELSCDRQALRGSGARPDEYGRTLLDQARAWIAPGPRAATGFLGPRSMLLARLELLPSLHRPRRPLLGLLLATVVAVCCMPARTTRAGPAYEDLEGCLQKRFFVMRAMAAAAEAPR
ncbi:MAG: M56 family metallopeptidase [Planctomycetota bacterium]